MLQSLRVRNLAIVEDIQVEFGKGLNVVTGETGAGKSVIVGALALILGDRADHGMIRANEDHCSVDASFLLADSSDIDSVLEELGIEACEDGRLVLRRVISANGAGKNLINDCPTTLQALKRVGDLLVDMHGPHDHQSLLSQDFQLDLLDSFGHSWKTRSAYEEAYRHLLDLEQARRELEGGDENVAEKIDMLAYQIKEITEAQLEGTDEEKILKEHTTVASAQRIIELANGIQNALTEDESSAFNSLVAAQNALREMAELFEEAGAWRKEAEAAAAQIQEISRTIAGAVQRIEADPARLQWLDDRLALLQKLKRKYGATVEGILTFLDQARARLKDLETRGERIAEINARIDQAKAAAQAKGRKLSEERGAAALSLAKAITRELGDLGFPHGAFDVRLDPTDPLPSGLDRVEFGFAPNVGEPMRPLRAIASSGEISRVMLASKAVLAAHDRIPVLIFDEIDANIGGEMGSAVGAKLLAVARTHQVLCITHLPQVAVHGTSHYVVTKTVREGRTQTEMRTVTGNARVEEVARMLGGRDLTSVTLKHAREMLTRTAAEK